MVKISAILIAGPTASGKSAVAIALARRLGGVIINTDSMQADGDLHVLSARPDAAEAAQAPHMLFGHVDGAVNYSVGRWLADARGALDAAQAQGLMPIFAGGTGLYFKALTQGLSAIPAVPEAVRARMRAEAEGKTPEVLHARLAALDPLTAAKLRPSDPQRILRALEVLAATGRPLASFQNARAAPLLDGACCVGVFLEPERKALAARINQRFDAMLAAGALNEVRALAKRGLDPALPVMRAHGVPHLLRHLRGEMTLGEAAERGKIDTRQYARRQCTWGRNQMQEYLRAAPEEAEAVVMAALVQGKPGLTVIASAATRPSL